MRRLPPVNKKYSSVLDVTVPGTANGILSRLEFNRGCESFPQRSRRPIHSSASASLPFVLTPLVELSSARFQLESVVRALPSLSRSQSADRFGAIHRPDRRRYAVARTRRQDESALAAFPPGHTLTPLSSLSSSQHSTCC